MGIPRKDVIEDDLFAAGPKLTKDFKEFYEVLLNISKLSRDIKLPSTSGASGGSQATGAEAVNTTKKLKEETAALTVQQKELAKVQAQIAATMAKTNDEYVKEVKTLENVKRSLKDKIALGERDAKQ